VQTLAGFKTVSISKALHETIVQFIKDNPEYRSVADFVSESARVRMHEITITFTEEQQSFIDELVDRAFQKGKETAKA
jgi:Arc/MetJ-type ribon-helix-helix transcriptional regulator